jgi:predicted dehydrogenase
VKATSTALTGGVAPMFIPAGALGKDGRPAPSERIVCGSIGVGMRGPKNHGAFMKEADAQVVAVCDIDKTYLERSRQQINKHYGNEDCAVYHEFQDLLAREDIDAVQISLPDHWHAHAAIAAAEAGKHIWGEKPLAHSLAECQAIVRAVEKAGVVWQTGSWQRSVWNFREAMDLIYNGRIGTIRRVEVGLPTGHNDFGKTRHLMQVTTPPPTLDYERWVGQAELKPYIPAQVHQNWRWVLDYGGGQLMDWVGHHVDIAHWGMKADDTGPLWIEGAGEYPPADAVWNSPTHYRLEAEYASGIHMTICSSSKKPQATNKKNPKPAAPKDPLAAKYGVNANGEPIYSGTKFIGDHGWIHVNRGQFSASNPDWIKEGLSDRETPLPLPAPKSHRNPHHRQFLDVIRNGGQTLTPVTAAHRSASVGLLGQIAMRTGRRINWDPKTETIQGDKDATRMMTPKMRKGYRIDLG